MKKLLTILLGLLLMVSLFGLVACGEETTEETPHTHTYETTWTSDETHHYKKANCEHTTEISEKAEHVFGDDEICDICGYEIPHTHTYETTWTSDENHHYKKATCEHTAEISEKAEHVFGDDEICDICGYEIPHTYTVSKEVWEQKTRLVDYENFSYVVVGKIDESEFKQQVLVTKDGIAYITEVDSVVVDETILVEKEDGIYGYNYSLKDGKYFDLTKMDDISSKTFNEYLKVKYGTDYYIDLFDEFTFNNTTNEYIAVLNGKRKNEFNDSYTVFDNNKVSIKFIDNNLSCIKIDDELLITIGNAVVTIPTETIPNLDK